MTMPLRCRLGLHKKVWRVDSGAWHTFLMVGVSLEHCTRCDFHHKAIGEGKKP